MTKKDYVLSVLYRLIKYSKLLSTISCISMVCLVLWPIFYSLKGQVDAFFGLYVAFCVLWIVSYISCTFIAAICYGRHIKRMNKLVKEPLKSLMIATIVFPYGTSLGMYFYVKNLSDKVQNNIIIVEEEKPELSTNNE